MDVSELHRLVYCIEERRFIVVVVGGVGRMVGRHGLHGHPHSGLGVAAGSLTTVK